MSAEGREQMSAESLAYRILQLENSLNAYQQLHAEELDELERRLKECKKEVLIAMSEAERGSQVTESEEENALPGELEGARVGESGQSWNKQQEDEQ